MDEKQLQEEKDKIDKMSQTEMARLWRFAPSGHPYFVTGSPLFEHFNKRFKGFTTAISKEVGWEKL